MLCCLSLSLPGTPSYARPWSYLDFIQTNAALATASMRGWYSSLACLKVMAVALFAMRRLGKSPEVLLPYFAVVAQQSCLSKSHGGGPVCYEEAGKITWRSGGQVSYCWSRIEISRLRPFTS